MPQQWFLEKLDPEGKRTVPELRCLLEQHMLVCKALVVDDWVDPRMKVKKALRLYKKWNYLTRAPTWGVIPIICTVAVCLPNCVSHPRHQRPHPRCCRRHEEVLPDAVMPLSVDNFQV